MSQPDMATRLNEAINLINAGRREEARTILLALSEQYPRVEQIWMWLVATTDDTEARLSYLRRVLDINPNNEKARAAYTRLTGETLPIRETPASSPPAPSISTRSIETLVIGVLIFVLIAVAVVVVATVATQLLNPRPTPTPAPSLTPVPTQTFTSTPSITPGGPTLTFIPGKTLPPSWTPAPTSTPAPTRTRPPTLTPLPSPTPSPTIELRPTITHLPTFTPGGPLLPTSTPVFSETPAVTPQINVATRTPTPESTELGQDVM
jgi:hypothetical protein